MDNASKLMHDKVRIERRGSMNKIGMSRRRTEALSSHCCPCGLKLMGAGKATAYSVSFHRWDNRARSFNGLILQ